MRIFQPLKHPCFNGYYLTLIFQSSWSKGISETNLKLLIPCSKCMHQPVTSQADACTSQAYACMYCMHCPMTSQANACSYCMDSVVLIFSRIYLYLQLLCYFLLSLSNHRHKQTRVSCGWFAEPKFMPSSSFRRDKIYGNPCFESGHTLLCCLGPTGLFKTNPPLGPKF